MDDILTDKLVERIASQWEVSEDRRRLLLERAALSDDQATPGARPSSVGVSFAVSTFVAKKKFHNFVMPPFGAHWGVVCDHAADVRTLYHLVFDPKERRATFDATSWKREWDVHEVTHVGTTVYDYVQLRRIGSCLRLVANYIRRKIVGRVRKTGKLSLYILELPTLCSASVEAHMPELGEYRLW